MATFFTSVFSESRLENIKLNFEQFLHSLNEEKRDIELELFLSDEEGDSDEPGELKKELDEILADIEQIESAIESLNPKNFL